MKAALKDIHSNIQDDSLAQLIRDMIDKIDLSIKRILDQNNSPKFIDGDAPMRNDSAVIAG